MFILYYIIVYHILLFHIGFYYLTSYRLLHVPLLRPGVDDRGAGGLVKNDNNTYICIYMLMIHISIVIIRSS